MTSPQAPPEVVGLLDELASRLAGIFHEELVGLYLYGSLVLGDFEPARSDLDLLAAIARKLDDDELLALRALHADFVREHPDWDDRVEVAYVPIEGLRGFKSCASTVAIVSPGEPLQLKTVGREWLIDYYVVRKHGIALIGPSPDTLIAEITQDEFLDAIREHLRSWIEPIPIRPQLGPYRYAVLTMCRGLHALEHGTQGSKKQAAVWAQRRFPVWGPVIERALTGMNRDPATDADRREAARFVEFALEVAQVS